MVALMCLGPKSLYSLMPSDWKRVATHVKQLSGSCPLLAFHGRPIVAAAVARESRRVSSVQQTVAVANPPPARDPVLMTQVREAVAATLREVAAPAAALQKAPPQPWKANNGHEPLSCFT